MLQESPCSRMLFLQLKHSQVLHIQILALNSTFTSHLFATFHWGTRVFGRTSWLQGLIAASRPDMAGEHFVPVPVFLGGRINTYNCVAMFALLWGEVDAISVVATIILWPGDVVIVQHRTGDQTHQTDLSSEAHVLLWDHEDSHCWLCPSWKTHLVYWGDSCFLLLFNLFVCVNSLVSVVTYLLCEQSAPGWSVSSLLWQQSSSLYWLPPTRCDYDSTCWLYCTDCLQTLLLL